MRHGSLRTRLIMGAAMTGLAAFGYGRAAVAGTCTGGPDVFVCSGPAGADVTQSLSGAPLSVTTTAGFGITTAAGHALALTGTGGVTFTDNAASAINGEKSGISAVNTLAGGIIITTTGTVTGNSGSVYAGIRAYDTGSGGVTLNVATVQGAGTGILAQNTYGGTLSVTATGTVSGGSDYGISAYDNGLGDLIINAVTVTGGQRGISARNLYSGGNLQVTTTGTVTGTAGIGLYARDVSTGGITITAVAVSGGTSGIDATNFGGGDLVITANGAATGTSGHGIKAFTGNANSILRVTIGAGGSAAGGAGGLDATHQGFGTFVIDNSGTIERLSHDAGLEALKLTGIIIGGTVENRAGATIRGLMTLTTFGDQVNNAGTWVNAGGSSNFDAGSDTLANLAGGIVRVGTAGAAQLTNWNGLESFQNAGRLEFDDGGVGDVLTISGDFQGQGGTLALDVAMGGADLLVVNGATSGTTAVQLTVLGTLQQAANAELALIDVSNTQSTAVGHFALASGPIQSGAYLYDLELGADGIWYLRAVGDAPNGGGIGFNYATLVSAALNHVETLMEPAETRLDRLRQQDSAAASGQTAALGLADLAMGMGEGAPHWLSVWGQGIGSEGEYSPSGAAHFEQTTKGFSLGADLGLGGLFADGDRLYLGLLAAYGRSEGDQAASSFDITGWSFGGYATYLAADATPSPYDGLHLDLLLHAGWLEGSVTTPLGHGDAEGWAWGARLQAGYGFEVLPGLILEPRAGVAWTQISQHDASDSLGSDIELDDGTSLKAHAALRLQKHWNLYSLGQIAPFLEARVEQEFLGDNQVTSDGVTVQSDVGGTSYGIALGLDAAIGGNLSVYGAAELTWGEYIQQETQVSGGLRFSF